MASFQELNHRESEHVEGGALRLPELPQPGSSLTWKYTDGTPEWAIETAKSMGWETEEL